MSWRREGLVSKNGERRVDEKGLVLGREVGGGRGKREREGGR